MDLVVRSSYAVAFRIVAVGGQAGVHRAQRVLDVGGDLAIPGGGVLGGHARAQVAPPERGAFAALHRHHLAQEDGHVAAVHGVEQAALVDGEAVFQNRAAGDARARGEAGELVAVAAGAQAEAVDELVLVIAEQVDGEGAGGGDEVVGEVALPEGGGETGALGHDRGSVDGDGDLAAAHAVVCRRHGDERRPEEGEGAGGVSGGVRIVHDVGQRVDSLEYAAKIRAYVGEDGFGDPERGPFE